MRTLPVLICCLFACTQPPSERSSKKAPTKAATSNASSLAASSSSAATSEEAPDNLKLSLSATAPIREPTPPTPQKSDPECEAQGADLNDTERSALFSAYIDIQKDYLAREKGVKDFQLKQDSKESLQYELSFKDIFGNAAKMSYKFGKAIVGDDGRVTLCLDEGAKLLWAGTYKRDPAKKFIPDL